MFSQERRKKGRQGPGTPKSTRTSAHFRIFSKRRNTPRRPPGGVITLCTERRDFCARLPTVGAMPYTGPDNVVLPVPGQAGKLVTFMLESDCDTERPLMLAETWNLHVHSYQLPRHHPGGIETRTSRRN
jgi:hypothetical protein